MNKMRDFGNILFLILPVSGLFSLKHKIAKIMGIVVDKGVSINGHTWFYGRGQIQIGEYSWLGVGCKFYTVAGHSIGIGKNCDIAPNVNFVPGTHEIGTTDRRAGKGYSLNIRVEDGCWIGTRVTILGGVTIGKGTMVAAGSVVTADIPENCLAAGVPAVVKKYFKN